MTLLLKPSMQWHFHNMKCWKLLLKLYAVCFNMSISIRHVVHAFKCFLLVLEADTILHQHYRFRLNYCHVSSHWFSLARTDRNGSSPSTYRQRIQEKKQEIERCGGLASHVGIDIWLYDICIIVLSYCIVCPDFVEWYEWCWMNDSCNSHTTYLTRLPIHSRISWDSSPLNLTGGELLFMPLLDQTQLGLCWSCQTRLLHGPYPSLPISSLSFNPRPHTHQRKWHCLHPHFEQGKPGRDMIYLPGFQWYKADHNIIFYSYLASVTNMNMRVDVSMSRIHARHLLFSSACFVLKFWLQKESTVRTKFGTTYSTTSLAALRQRGEVGKLGYQVCTAEKYEGRYMTPPSVKPLSSKNWRICLADCTFQPCLLGCSGGGATRHSIAPCTSWCQTINGVLQSKSGASVFTTGNVDDTRSIGLQGCTSGSSVSSSSVGCFIGLKTLVSISRIATGSTSGCSGGGSCSGSCGGTSSSACPHRCFFFSPTTALQNDSHWSQEQSGDELCENHGGKGQQFWMRLVPAWKSFGCTAWRLGQDHSSMRASYRKKFVPSHISNWWLISAGRVVSSLT